jgi:hypothetical protein
VFGNREWWLVELRTSGMASALSTLLYRHTYLKHVLFFRPSGRDVTTGSKLGPCHSRLPLRRWKRKGSLRRSVGCDLPANVAQRFSVAPC